jgi:hypothetical protein
MRIALIEGPLRDVQLLGFAALITAGVSQRFVPQVYGLERPARDRQNLIFWLINGSLILNIVIYVLLLTTHELYFALGPRSRLFTHACLGLSAGATDWRIRKAFGTGPNLQVRSSSVHMAPVFLRDDAILSRSMACLPARCSHTPTWVRIGMHSRWVQARVPRNSDEAALPEHDTLPKNCAQNATS